MLDLRIIIIDEPIHIYDELALNIWQKTLWIKNQEYQKHYKTSILPYSTEDFFATQVIIAEETDTNRFAPLSMYRIVTRSRCKKYFSPFCPDTMLDGTGYEDSFVMKRILQDSSDIGYLSSWAVSRDYRKKPHLIRKVRDLITTTSCLVPETLGCNRWLVAGAVQHRADEYLRWIGCNEVLPDSFAHPNNSNVPLRMLYLANTQELPEHTQTVINECSNYWQNRLIFNPSTKVTEKAA